MPQGEIGLISTDEISASGGGDLAAQAVTCTPEVRGLYGTTLAQVAQRSARIMNAAVALFGAATVLGFLDGLAWQFELATFFRLQYAGVLLVLVLLALLLRFIRVAAAAALLACVNIVCVASPFADREEATGRGAPLRLLVVNVHAGNDRYGDLERLVREVRPDVIGVTELDSSWASELEHRLPGFDQRLVMPEEGAYGIGVFSRLPLVGNVERFPEGAGPPTVVARLRPRGAAELTLVVTHVHTPFAGSIHKRHLDALAAARPRLGQRLAVCGDFNTVPWGSAFKRLASEGLTDLYSGSWPGYSWPTWNPAPTATD